MKVLSLLPIYSAVLPEGDKMNVNGLTEIGNAALAPTAQPNNTEKSGELFNEMLQKFLDVAGHKELNGVSERLKAGEIVPNNELLRYQIQAHELSMKTELLSKAGEAISGTLRRLQQPG
jgi:hypothetical protein